MLQDCKMLRLIRLLFNRFNVVYCLSIRDSLTNGTSIVFFVLKLDSVVILS